MFESTARWDYNHEFRGCQIRPDQFDSRAGATLEPGGRRVLVGPEVVGADSYPASHIGRTHRDVPVSPQAAQRALELRRDIHR